MSEETTAVPHGKPRGHRPPIKTLPPRRLDQPDDGTEVRYHESPADPLQDIFKTQGVHLVGDETDTIPEEVSACLEEHGMGTRAFNCILRQLPEGLTNDSTSEAPFVKAWKRSIPSIEYIGKVYGPGNYCLIFSWRAPDPETKIMRTMTERIPFTISDKYMTEHKNYLFEQRLKLAGERREKLRDAKLEKEFDVLTGKPDEEEQPKVNVQQAAKEYVKELAASAAELGFVRPQAAGFPWKDMLPMLLPALPAILKMFMDRSNHSTETLDKVYGLLIAQMNNSNQQLVEAVKASQGVGQGNNSIKEFRDMIFGAIDIKEALNGKQESTADRIFGLIETVAPQIFQMAAAGQAARAMNPAYYAAKGYMQHSPDFQALSRDPALFAELVNKLDAYYGWQQTDKILEVGEMQRPAQCPRDPAKQFPPSSTPPEGVKDEIEVSGEAEEGEIEA